MDEQDPGSTIEHRTSVRAHVPHQHRASTGDGDETAASSRRAPESGDKTGTPFWTRAWVIISGTLLLFLVLGFGVAYAIDTYTHETTDNAFLDANVVSISPKISGQVVQVPVEDNQFVQAGDLLLEIDPRDPRIQLQQKQAALASARANTEMIEASLDLFRRQIETAEATAKESEADAAAARATLEKANADLARTEQLYQDHTVSQQEYDTTKAAAQVALANLHAGEEKAAGDRSKVAEVRAQLEAGLKGFSRAEAQSKQAQMDVEAAQLNLSYTRITAPLAGRVTRKGVQSGDYVQAGQKVLALVPPDLFVTANFKETQLRDIRPGQPVNVKIDAVNRGPFPARVDSIMAGTGARFSLLPPENAVGNFVKVVQRVPVKIVFISAVTADHVLGPGMSVEPAVRISSFRLPHRVIWLGALVLAGLAGTLWLFLARRRNRPQEVSNPVADAGLAAAD